MAREKGKTREHYRNVRTDRLRKKKRLKAGLPEMHVGRQDIENSVTVHYTET
jgi:hypothetical protein